ncbi:MAG: hypothetical protein BVN33_07695 [Proteobacteria bacterium ST_bin13]|jgi:acyl-CoA reductase-like NAD-dependent aldehyde dehydrogenase|nr:MAG: hypothetical protein BVN33_07695 [Proteobacteria bacterium ST_bin13]
MSELSGHSREHTRLLSDYRRSWIDGRSVDDAEGAMSHIYAGNGEALGESDWVGAAGIDRAVAAARRAFASWGAAPLGERRAALHRFADAIAANVERLAMIESLEAGRPLGDATILIAQAPDFLRRYIGMIDGAQGDVIAGETRQINLSWRRPRGVVAAILPWNFPVMNMMVRIAPALAAGNCLVVKPSENTPHSAVMLARLASEAGLPDGVLNVVLGDGAGAGRVLAEHADIDLLTFTGSTETGLAISRGAAARTLKPVLLECGGKSPQILLDDIFDDGGIWQPIFFSSFWNSGQWCAAKTRLLVPRARVEQAVEALKGAAAAWQMGDPLAEGTRLGPLINAAQHARVEHYFDAARRLGTVEALGCPSDQLDPRGLFVQPSVALGQPRGSEVVREEVFGPLLTIEAYDDIDDAITLANDSDYGLMANAWTRRSDLAHRLSRSLVAGAITLYSSGEAAFATPPDVAGAYLEPQKQSGHGVDGGLPGLLAYSTAQSVAWLH